MSKTNESKLYALLKKHLKNVHLVRIESYTENGIPDINACSHGKETWIELKANNSKDLGLSKWQKVWIAKRIKAGGRVIILNRPLEERVIKFYKGSVVLDPSFSVNEPCFTFKEPIDWSLLQLMLFTDPRFSFKSR